MTINGVLFDLDGTLIDSGLDLANAYNLLRQENQLPALSLESLKPAVAYGIVPLSCKDFHVSRKDSQFAVYQKAFTRIYTDNLTRYTTLFPGVADMLTALDDAQIPWGIVTNKPKRFATPIVNSFSEFNTSRCMIAGDTLSHAKPHPFPLQHACESLRTAPNKTAMVGDTEIDIQAGQRAGCPTVAVSYGYQNKELLHTWKATLIIDHPAELLPWLIEENTHEQP